MSKWKSETTDLISRAQIVDFVAEIIKRPEAKADAAAEFSARAATLITAVEALSPTKRSTYFKEIGVSDPGDLDAWLAPTKEEIDGLTELDVINQEMERNPTVKALIKREAKRERKTVKQIEDEIRAEV